MSLTIRMVHITVCVLAILTLMTFSTSEAQKSYHLAFLQNIPSPMQDIVGKLYTEPIGAYSSVRLDSSVTDCVPRQDGGNWYFSAPQCQVLAPNEAVVAKGGIKIVVDDTTVVHVEQTDGALKKEAYLAIPDEHLGTEYYVSTQCSLGSKSQIAVTPVDSDTSVCIQFPSNISVAVKCSVDQSLFVHTDNNISCVLQEYDVLHVESDRDLTGTYIKADKKVSVVVGASGVFENNALIIEQIPPTNKWGKDFIVVQSGRNEAGDMVKILTRTDNTEIHISGFSPFIIPYAGQSVERKIDGGMHSYIRASNPVLVLQILGTIVLNNSTYNSTPPSMVLIPSIDQWKEFKWLPFKEGCDILAVCNVTDNNLAQVPGTEYFAGMPTYHARGVKMAYAVCITGSSFLFDADWTVQSKECSRTVPVPGDNVDNDCDGLTDEDVCTEEDLVFVFQSKESDVHPGHYTIGHANIEGATEVTFTLQMCHAVVLLGLLTNSTPGIYTNIQISNGQLAVMTKTQVQLQNVTLNNCSEAYKFFLKITYEVDAIQHVLFHESADYFWLLEWTVETSEKYTSMTASSLVNEANFTIDLLQKDCGKIYSDEPDSFGKRFIAPLKSNAVGESFIFISAVGGDADVTLSHFSDAGFMEELIKVDIVNSSTFLVSSTEILRHYSGIIIESTTEISVYVVECYWLCTNWLGYKLIPTDVLGLTYYPYTNGSLCTVATSKYDVIISSPTEFPLDRYTTFEMELSDFSSTSEIRSSRPISVFCGNRTTPGAIEYHTFLQMVPKEMMGRQFYIPKLSGLTGAKLYITSIEDSTVNIVKGNYDNLDILEYRGKELIRHIEEQFLYNISSSKPIQLVLEVINNDMASLTVIPPVSQYSALHFYPNFLTAQTPYYYQERFAVDKFGNSSSASPALGWFDYGVETFTLSVLVNRNSGQKTLYPGDTLFLDINQVCVLGMSEDDDCDGFIDEETCGDTVDDADLDGLYNEDCDRPPLAIRRPLTLACPEGTQHEETIETTTGFNSIKPRIPTPSPDMEIPPVPLPANLSFPVLTPTAVLNLPPLDSSGSSVSNTSQNNTQNRNEGSQCLADCECPCEWLQSSHNYTEDEIKDTVNVIKDKLQVSKKELSVSVRKKICAKDDRPSATAVGYVAIVFIVVSLSTIVLLEVSTLMQQLGQMKRNLQNILMP